MANLISKIAASGLAGITRTSPYSKLESKISPETVSKIIGYTTIGSVVAKDAVGCGMYVYQSLHNDKIPEKRRKFVSALDLTNGLLMIVSQVIFFFATEKISGKFSDMLFKSFRKGSKAICSYAETIRADQKILKSLKKLENVESKDNIAEEFDKMKTTAQSLVKSVTQLAAATILAKRIVVPFIATPLAKKVEAQMDKRGIGVKCAGDSNKDVQETSQVKNEAKPVAVTEQPQVSSSGSEWVNKLNQQK